MPKVSDEYRDARREHILRAAQRCFLRDGFHATSMQDLFAEAELSSGAVYGYFAGKDDLILAIVEENMRDVVAMIHSIATERRGVPLGVALAEVVELVAARHAETGLGGIAVQVWAEVLRNEALAQRFRKLVNRLRADLSEVVREHQVAGDLPADVPAAAIAAVLTSIVPGYIVQLSTLGPASVRGVPAALRALWP